MKKLKYILYKVSVNSVVGCTDVEINKINFDSRKISKHDVFVAQVGINVDGHNFINKAIDLGAKVIVCEKTPFDLIQNIIYVVVDDSSEALATMSSNYYNNPSEKIKLIGVTGTNGKTTVSTLLYRLFKKLGYRVGLLSTVKIMIDDLKYDTTQTTPDSLEINMYLSKMISAGVEYCFMEVSSHGISQKRTFGLSFNGGVFTNLTHDHLDYHNSFAQYRDVKKSFFDSLSNNAFALTNIDDKNGELMLQNTKAKKFSYALKTLADYKSKILEKRFSGTLIFINEIEVWVKLIGEFNIYNILCIYGVAELLGIDKIELLKAISELESVTGRFQYIKSKQGVVAIVDYAHTPDALKNVLETINSICYKNQNVITVVGCGGDRDKTKRPEMAKIAVELSTLVVFTSDNSRSEEPQDIIKDMEYGVKGDDCSKILSIIDRKQAIKTACKLAKQGDIILIAGKGHEKYQEIKGEFFHFSDFEEVKNCFNQLKIN